MSNNTNRFREIVYISLQNRKVSKMEVETFLEQYFEGCSFIVKSSGNSVGIIVE